MSIPEPIVLIGGFGSHWSDYRSAARALANVSGRRVFIAGLTRITWMLAGLTDYGLLVNRTHAAVNYALKQTGAHKVILVGHSAGGVVGRAYLGDRTLRPHQQPHHGYERVSRLYTVGSPLRATKEASQRGMRAVAWVDETYPGAYYAPQVKYFNVRGRYIEGKLDGSLRQREAYYNYRFISGNGTQWGDGVVPVSLSELDGAATLELEGVGHSPGWNPWFFGDASVIRAWWHHFESGDGLPIRASEGVA
ncbi:MAG: alpha/beta hydrolase [Thermoflexales bacterium]|nr:alpha/beta hydrolase [Thermoflexales bacterium]